MPAVTREIKLTYGAFIIGGGTDYLIHDNYTITQDYDETTVEISCIVAASSEADFETACTNIEAAFRKPRQLLKIEIGGTTFLDYDPADNTGFNAEPRIEKPGSIFDSARSRLYRIVLSIERPADIPGDDGLRDAAIRVTKLGTGQRIAEITGAYTALTVNDAVTQYETSISTYITGITGGLSGTWEELSTDYDVDKQNKNVKFKHILKEVIFNQAVGVLDHVAIKNQRLAVTRSMRAPGDTETAAKVTRPIEMSILYDAEIDIAEETDLKSLYEQTIFPWIIQYARDVTDSQTISVVNSSPVFDHNSNKVTASVQIKAYGGSSLISHRVVTTDQEDFGLIIVPVWNAGKYGNYIYQGPATKLRSRRVEQIRQGHHFDAKNRSTDPWGGGQKFGLEANIHALLFSPLGELTFTDPEDSSGIGGISAGKGTRERWIKIKHTKATTPVTEGITGYQVPISSLTEITVMQLIKEVSPVISALTTPHRTGASRPGKEGF